MLKFFILQGLELRLIRRSAPSQSPYRLRYLSSKQYHVWGLHGEGRLVVPNHLLHSILCQWRVIYYGHDSRRISTITIWSVVPKVAVLELN
jgi:hypothetical protein